ncbi:hypothetical protein SBOR_2551 [Sclerotinia borealis F-4128]|uniref:Uncharacterized protein n=1 Tax=Sclerotinia borealis (strain F-4128) TaxID=1432307 RepID=W9CRD9_SCLBF|nr:hypothetical protein SBOR_2551 [Sclerotinia borealis F-4128]
MGGLAFVSHILSIKTPRMSREVYNKALKQNQAILRGFYSKVASAIEGPGKTTYGDVDILVALPLKDAFSSEERVADRLKKALNAVAWIQDKGSPTINFAVPWPKNSIAGDGDVVGEGGGELDESTDAASEEWYVQVDVHTCKDEHEFGWELFHSSHGDLWNIIGTTIRRFGLTVNNRALFIRIPEIELADRKKSMLFLTDEPTKILDFLGLDEEKWWKRFSTRQEMFEYAASCRMFSVKDIVEGEVKERKKLKHNDRQRMTKRPTFKAWVDEFIPQCRKERKYGDSKITRKEIRNEVFEKFGVKGEYETRQQEWNLKRHLMELTRDGIKGNIPLDTVDGQMRLAAIKVLKGIIIDGEPYEGSVPKAAMKDENGFYDLELVKHFVIENWENAGRAGMARQQVKIREVMKAKAEINAKAKAEQDYALQ